MRWKCLDRLGSNSMAFVVDSSSSFSRACASRTASGIFEDFKWLCSVVRLPGSSRRIKSNVHQREIRVSWRRHKGISSKESRCATTPQLILQSWLKTVAYPDECDAIPSSVIKHALRLVFRVTGKSRETHGVSHCFWRSVLEQAGVVKSPEGGFDIGKFVDTQVVRITWSEQDGR